MTYLQITGKRWTCFNSSLKLRKEKRYAIELTVVKCYKKDLLFHMINKLNGFKNHFLELA